MSKIYYIIISNKSYRIELEHNSLLIMGGKCQETHYHSVPKVKMIITGV